MSMEEAKLTDISRRKEIIAALLELQFWARTMKEHARLIYNGLDPKEATFLGDAELLILGLEALEERVDGLLSNPLPWGIGEAMEESHSLIGELRKYKGELAALLARCKVLALLPDGLIEHFKREANFFLNSPAGSKKNLYRHESPGNTCWRKAGACRFQALDPGLS